jgi:hypothetical protein
MHPRKAACRDFSLGILIFKRLIARRLYKSFGVKGLKDIGPIGLQLIRQRT